MYIKYYVSGNIIEEYQYERKPIPRETRKSRLKNRQVRVIRNRRADNVRQLKATFKRLVATNLFGTEDPLLFTFTYAQRNTDYDTGVIYWKKFTNRLRRIGGRNIKYIAVPEYQKRGTLHIHVLFWGIDRSFGTSIKKVYYNGKWRYKKTKQGYERIYRIFQNLWGYGYVDVIRTDGSPKLASYLSKYYTKSLYDRRISGKKAYFSSRNIQRPYRTKNPVVVEAQQCVKSLDEIPIDKEYNYMTYWLGKCRYIKRINSL